VLSHLNERKKEAMECFTSALAESEQNDNKIRKCIEKLMRILHKDRHHTLAHYRHLLKSNPSQSSLERDYTLQRLTQISSTARTALKMLERFPALNSKLRPLVEDYVLSLQGRDDPTSSLLSANRESESALLQKYEEMRVDISSTTTTTEMSSSTTIEKVNDEIAAEDDDEDNAVVDEKEIPAVVNTNNFIHDQIISVRREVFGSHNNKSPPQLFFVTLGFAGIAVLGAVLIGVIVLVKRRVIDHPKNHGFLEVNQQLHSNSNNGIKSPEEKHVASMQVNGYVNPTYAFFETSSNPPVST